MNSAKLLYNSPQNVERERKLYYLYSLIVILLWIFSVVVALSSYPLPAFLLFFSIPFGFILFSGLMFWLYAAGIHEFKVYENGFVTPKSVSLQRFIKGDYFVEFKDVKKVYLNKLTTKKLFYPFYVVTLSDDKLVFIPKNCIEPFQIKDYFPTDIEIVEQYFDKYVIIWPFKRIPKVSPNLYVFHPPQNLFIKTSKLELHYDDKVFTLLFGEMKKIGLRSNWVVEMRDGTKYGIYDLSMDQRWEIVKTFKKWKKASGG